MDQLRVAMTWLKEQHFWVLSVLATIVSVVCWFLASGAVDEQFTANRSKIKSAINSVNNLKNQPFHPNPTVNDGQRTEIEKLAGKVETVWSQLHDRQQEEVLKWPEQLDSKASGNADRFLLHIAGKGFGDFIGNKFRERYGDYIKNRFPDLPAIIQAMKLEDRRGGSRGGTGEFAGEGPGMMTGEEELEEQDYLVIWEDQQTVRDQLNYPGTPSSMRIWVTQEDLWVYETLLRAIAATNEKAGADRYTNAAVRNIYQFQVGAEAAKGARTDQRIYRPEGDAAAAGGGGFEGGFDETGGGGFSPGLGDGLGEGFETGGLSGEDGDESQQLLAGRYVNADGTPVPAPAPGQPMNFGAAEYKRLPVRLTLKMDQRWLHFLIAALANAPLQVEVDEVRLNPVSADSGSGDAVGFRPKRLRALELAGKGAASGFDSGSSRGDVSAFPREPHIANVILRGTVFIFNEPDSNVLSVDGQEDLGAF